MLNNEACGQQYDVCCAVLCCVVHCAVQEYLRVLGDTEDSADRGWGDDDSSHEADFVAVWPLPGQQQQRWVRHEGGQHLAHLQDA